MKTWIITSILCLAIILMPSDAKPQEKPPSTVVMGCLVLVIGTIVVIGLVHLCKKIPAMNGSNDPPPTNPPPIMNPTNRPSWTKEQRRMHLDWPQVPTISVSIPDPYAQHPSATGSTFTIKWSVTIQSSTNLRDWHDALAMTVWESDSGGAFYACARNGTNQTFYFTQQTGTNSIPVDFTDATAEKEFFRLVAP
jgi:hypothetical protein